LLLPHEVAARHVIPYLRAAVAQALHSRGYGQDRIARLLGVTQAMVSKYLSWGREYVERRLSDAGVPVGDALSLAGVAAEKLARGDTQGYIEIMTSFVNQLLAGGTLCPLHRRLGAPASCNICANLFVGGRDDVLAELSSAVERFTAEAGPDLVPNVGSNIVYARSGARGLEEVAGLTGAIIKLSSGRLVAVGEPRYGGSRHTAQVLLLVMKRWPSIRAAVVVAYSEDNVKSLESMGRVIRVGPHCCPEKLLDDIRRGLEAGREEPVAIASLGGYNLEPVIYVLGRDASEAVERALSCRRRASA